MKKVLRRYWVAGLVLMMVAVHAAVIGYVRSRVARLRDLESTAVEIGSFRFQPVKDLDTVYHFQLHAVVDPTKRHRGEARIAQMRMEIREASEQLLRQVDPKWLEDPTQNQIRSGLMDVVLRHLDEPLVQRVLITDWLEIPVETVDVLTLNAEASLAAR
ncbi:MAG: hypothetical protein MI861_07395 [Pirellulales bacterium]|nr:hypothetical protein [Pirellulales bacterium]